jgi:carotenoid 1,2-hydratase
MAIATQKVLKENFSYTSSIALDVWQPKSDAKAFDWWYFDALSEDGRDAVVVIFIDNFIFSPRYNAANSRGYRVKNSNQIPAVAFYYYRDGVPVYRSINEFDADDFSAETDSPSCSIGNSSFTFKSAPYGSGYFVSIKEKVSKTKQIEAHFEWLSIETDFLHEKPIKKNRDHTWNMVVSRADVTGRITVSDFQGISKNVIHFRGTGYHDHSSDNRWLPETICDWQWGRAHFADSTAVFCRYKELSEGESINKLLTIKDGKLIERDAIYDETNFKRDKYGLKYPSRQTFLTDDGIRLRIKNQKVIDSSFFYIRFMSEMTLTLRDGKPRKTIGITQYLAPKSLKFRWLDWLVNLGIGRNGKASLIC